jgi:hypothetical protein
MVRTEVQQLRLSPRLVLQHLEATALAVYVSQLAYIRIAVLRSELRSFSHLSNTNQTTEHYRHLKHVMK